MIRILAHTKALQLIDFGPFLSSTASSSDRKSTADHVLSAFQRSGFLYITNHGIPPATIDLAFSHSAQFFAQSLADKNALAWDRPESNRGYSCMGQEKVTNDAYEKDGVADLRASNPDLKESYEIGREGVDGMPNQWPTTQLGGTGFREDMLDFFEACKKLHVGLLRAIALGLGIDERWFDEYSRVGDNTLRLLHYPAVERGVFERNKGQVRAGAHTDYGSITLLFQDDRGGLQVQGADGKTWVDATPVPGSIVVNAGDLLARWSNDVVKSTLHRVVEPPHPAETGSKQNGTNGREDTYPPRYSIAYFCNPDFHKFIDVVPGTLAGQAKKYEGVNSGEYLIRRLEATY